MTMRRTTSTTAKVTTSTASEMEAAVMKASEGVEAVRIYLMHLQLYSR